MPFKISLGECKCQKPYRQPPDAIACQVIEQRLAMWQASLPDGLGTIPREQQEDEIVEGHRLSIRTSKLEHESGEILVVIQALVHTWSRPTFLSFYAVGRMFAEGLLVPASGVPYRAPDDVMWEFR
jgi:hypothetical protein